MIRRPYADELRFDASDRARAIEPFGDGRGLAATLKIAPERLIVRFVGPDPSRLGVTDTEPTAERAVVTARSWREGQAGVDTNKTPTNTHQNTNQTPNQNTNKTPKHQHHQHPKTPKHQNPILPWGCLKAALAVVKTL